MSKEIIYSAGKLKELTGRFQIQAERKFHDQFNFVNHAYLIFTCNQLPSIGEDDAGFFDRVIIRNFSRVFGGHSKPDRNLIDKPTTSEELSGILSWGLQGYQRLKGNSWSFTNTKTLEIVEADYKRKSDPIWAFVQDCLEEKTDKAIEKLELYNEYKEWSEKNEIPLKSKDVFYKELPAKITVSSGYRDLGSGKVHCYVGIQLLNAKKGAPIALVALEQKELEQAEQSEQGSPNLRGS